MNLTMHEAQAHTKDLAMMDGRVTEQVRWEIKLDRWEFGSCYRA